MIRILPKLFSFVFLNLHWYGVPMCQFLAACLSIWSCEIYIVTITTIQSFIVDQCAPVKCMPVSDKKFILDNNLLGMSFLKPNLVCRMFRSEGGFHVIDKLYFKKTCHSGTVSMSSLENWLPKGFISVLSFAQQLSRLHVNWNEIENNVLHYWLRSGLLTLNIMKHLETGTLLEKLCISLAPALGSFIWKLLIRLITTMDQTWRFHTQIGTWPYKMGCCLHARIRIHEIIQHSYISFCEWNYI